MKPLPTPDPLTAPYWEAVRERRLALPRCERCGKFHFYPRSACPHCGGDRLAFTPVSGTGTVYSFTVVQRAPGPAFAAEVPYVVAVVALTEGPHLMSRLAGIAPGVVRIGMAVRVAFEGSGESTLPVFRPGGS